MGRPPLLEADRFAPPAQEGEGKNKFVFDLAEEPSQDPNERLREKSGHQCDAEALGREHAATTLGEVSARASEVLVPVSPACLGLMSLQSFQANLEHLMKLRSDVKHVGAHAAQGGVLQAELDRLVMQNVSLQATTSQAHITLRQMKHRISHRCLLRDIRVAELVGECFPKGYHVPDNGSLP